MRPARAARAAACAFLTLAGAAALAQAAAPEAADPPGWSLRRPDVAKPVFRGMASYDGAGMNTPPMTYPAADAASLLVAILTHGVISESVKQSQKDRLQAKADAVLRPYAEVLDGLSIEGLVATSYARVPEQQPRLLGAGDAAGPGPTVETAPVFLMPPDERTIVLDNALRVTPTPGDPARVQLVRVVSDPFPPAGTELTPREAWLADDGKALREVSAALFAESLRIALETAAGDAEPARPQRTVRFVFGSSERMERAEVLRERCGRLLLRTLRGEIMSVPTAKRADCTPAGG